MACEQRSREFQSVHQEQTFSSSLKCACVCQFLGGWSEVLHAGKCCISTPEWPLFVSPPVSIAGNKSSSLSTFPVEVSSKHTFVRLSPSLTGLWNMSSWSDPLSKTTVTAHPCWSPCLKRFLLGDGWGLSGFCNQFAQEKSMSTFGKKVAIFTLGAQNPFWQPVMAVPCVELDFPND